MNGNDSGDGDADGAVFDTQPQEEGGLAARGARDLHVVDINGEPHAPGALHLCREHSGGRGGNRLTCGGGQARARAPTAQKTDGTMPAECPPSTE